ncbi:MAG: hypothetical protein COV66_07805 [Nitrospinae bacterium CG11_big_fil_rev_8_21_14_0_20_45_15]|nr:MAG: hypothetical protein COV66_07805 [Nitrospinae bacterium CG11_big_fil_rev_8_21_14_0_20_45_15]
MKTHKKTGISLAFSLALTLFAVSMASAETLYIKKSGTTLLAEATSSAKVVATLKAGTAVQVKAKSGKYYQVAASGSPAGWVYKFKLGTEAPGGSGGDADLLGDLGGRQKVAARETGSSSSIRGLSPVSEQLAHKKGIPEESINAVKAMEKYTVPASELSGFLKEGKLGEYVQ